MLGLITVLATVFAVWGILRLYGVLDFKFQISKIKTRREKREQYTRSVSREQQILKTYTFFGTLLKGIFLNEYRRQDLLYYIRRLELRSEPLNRLLTPEEVVGKHVMILFITMIPAPFGFANPIFLIPLAYGVFQMYSYRFKYISDISEEDKYIEIYFNDLYLLLYSKLRQGSKARLQDTVQGYVETLNHSSSSVETDAMLKLGKTLLNLLTLYDDQVAIVKLRDYYRCATIVNFSNIAAQALSGVDSQDNLLTLRQSLSRKQAENMQKKADKLVKIGEYSIYAIYVVLFEFVLVGLISKLPTGFF